VYLLDTNHYSFILEGDTTVIENFRSRANVSIATSVIVAGELQFMVQNSHQRTANQIKIRAFLQRIEVHPIDLAIATIYGDFKAELIRQLGPKERSRRKTTRLVDLSISENDLWIAATALRHSSTIVSSDSDFERMRQIREFGLESWV
jgi:tRNA(fMet)-specific endonuclease VapC